MPVPDSPRVQCHPRCPQEQALGLPLEPRRLRRALSQQPLNCQSWLPAFERRSLELEESLPWGACPESPAGQWEELQELAQLDLTPPNHPHLLASYRLASYRDLPAGYCRGSQELPS